VATLVTADAVALVGGVGLGSAMWWLLLAGGTAWLGRDISAVGMQWINRISGVIICGFGVAALWSVIK
jgi:arginine exporter protein ArgO